MKQTVATWLRFSLVLSLCIFVTLQLSAQGSVQKGTPAGSGQVGGQTSIAQVPITSVSLFSSGVGYFVRQGRVEGSGSLQFQVDQANMNDLLKSMVVRDLDGGSILGMNYASQDPLARALAAFAVNLSGDPSVSDILTQLRGEQVQITASEVITGSILGIEMRTVATSSPAGGDTAQPRARAFLDLYTDSGVRSVSLDEVRTIKFLRADVDREIRLALGLIAASRNKDKKLVAVRYEGNGSRRLQIGYIQEMPVWKTSYRLAIDPTGVFMQGWALVENTTDEDWKGVRLDLVSGRPISFTMDLYTPIYLKRPEVSLGLAQAAVPPAYEQGLASGASSRDMAKSAAAPQASRYAEMAAPAPSGFSLDQGVQSAALPAEAGAFFQYTINSPVTIARRESAMVPIVNQKIEGERISIFNEQVDPKRPMNGLRLKNDTGLDLNAGPITVFEDGQYAGDAQIENLAPGVERLISFSVDLDTEIAGRSQSLPELLVSASVQRGTLVMTRKLSRERTYTIRYDGTKSRQLLIEYPLDPDWKLVRPTGSVEQTRSFYRFAVPLTPRSSSELTVREERTLSQSVVLSSTGLDTITRYQSSAGLSASVRAALAKLVSLRTELDSLKRSESEQTRQLTQIYSDQKRIRDNMSALDRTSALYNRYVSTLNSQEDEIGSVSRKVDDLKAQEAVKQKEIDNFLAGLTIQ